MRTLPASAAFAMVAIAAFVERSAAEAPSKPFEDIQIEFADPRTDPRAAEVQRTGIAATNFLGQRLVTELLAALKRGSTEDAVAVAHLQSISADGQIVPGMPKVRAFKLTGLRLINVANSPDYAEKVVLEAIERELRTATKPPELVVQRLVLPDGSEEWRAYRPMAVLPSCMSCHGNPAEKSPRLRTLLARRAPPEVALGYRPGEWRGLIRVTVETPPEA